MSSLFPLAFPVFFAGMWTGVSFLLSRMSGWNALVERYRAQAVPEGERITWASGQIDGVSFRSCLNLTLAATGLHLVPSLMFRLFMPALLIPWADIRFEGIKRIFFLEFSCFRLGAEGPLFVVRGATGDRLVSHLTEEARSGLKTRRAYAGTLFDHRIVYLMTFGAVLGLIGAIAAAVAGKR